MIARILHSSASPMPALRHALAVTAVLGGIGGLRLTLQSLAVPAAYHRDFIQEYLLAKAILNNANPYQPISTLAERLMGTLPVAVFPHPTPHPPPIAVLSLPLGRLPYQLAGAVWLGVEIILLFLALRLLFRQLGQPKWRPVLIACSALLAWCPVWTELVVGQLMTLLLVLLVLGWALLRAGRDGWGGVCLGLVFAFKLMAWPILIYLLLRGRWRAIWAAAATVIGANLAAVLLMGFETVLTYYTTVSATLMPLYRAALRNISTWTLGWRFFDGTGTPLDPTIIAPPLIHLPLLAQIVSLGLPLGLLAMGLVLALRAQSCDTAFGILVTVGILVSPVAWNHYLILTLIPLAITAQRLSKAGFPTPETLMVAGLILLMMIPASALEAAMYWLAHVETVPGQAASLPSSISLISLLPMLAALGVLWLSVHVDGHLDQQTNHVPALMSDSRESASPIPL